MNGPEKFTVNLNSKTPSKITIHGKFKAIIFKGFNKALDIFGIFAANGKIINPLNKNRTGASS
jgi:hypothetical protein